jgi:hypothetical protein
MKNIQFKIDDEQERMEELEVSIYEQSVKRATLVEDSDKILQFMEEFIKKVAGQKA